MVSLRHKFAHDIDIYTIKQQLLFLPKKHTCQYDIAFKKSKERADVANQEWDLKYHITS